MNSSWIWWIWYIFCSHDISLLLAIMFYLKYFASLSIEKSSLLFSKLTFLHHWVKVLWHCSLFNFSFMPSIIKDELLGLAGDPQGDPIFKNQDLNMDVLYRTGETQQVLLFVFGLLFNIFFSGFLLLRSTRLSVVRNCRRFK